MSSATLPAQAGRFLVAHPHMRDELFGSTLIYLTKVDEEGCEGFVLNKALAFHLGNILQTLPLGASTRVHWGGPVNTDSLYFLHKNTAKTLHSEPVNQNINCGHTYTDLLAALDNNDDSCFCCLGYAGWHHAQLQNEIEHQDWIVAELDLWAVLRHPPQDRWTYALLVLGYSYPFWKAHPPITYWN